MTDSSAGASAAPDSRRKAAASWAAETLGVDRVELQPVSADASFRRYFRFNNGDRSVVLMDAPPDKEDSAVFIDIASRIRAGGLKAPEILAFNLRHGFGLIEDFGDTLYRELISEQTVNHHIPDLFAVLEGLAHGVNAGGLPEYGEALLREELELFTTWYLGVHRHQSLANTDQDTWDRVCSKLIASARQQEQVFVHRDFHSCNLLATSDGPGIIDFQDGVRGPLSYDLVSLLWDRYIAWPRLRLEKWMTEAHELLAPDCDLGTWIRQCDWMGLQRNLKIVGIFARLKHRDQKEGYVEMIPRFYQYLLDVVPLYAELDDLHELLERNKCAP